MTIGEKICAGAILLIIVMALITLVLGVLGRPPSEPPDQS